MTVITSNTEGTTIQNKIIKITINPKANQNKIDSMRDAIDVLLLYVCSHR